MSIPPGIQQSLADQGYMLTNSAAVSGGDINQARRLTTTDGQRYFLKYNSTSEGSQLLLSELKGLALLEKKGHPTVNVIAHDLDVDTPYLMMDWIDESTRSDDKLANALKDLHNTSNEAFGLDYDSYIGSLNKPAGLHERFSTFYTELRIEPQLRMAFDKGYKFKIGLETFDQVISSTFPIESPSLVHGDLWSGNLMDGGAGPIFIDPSVEYSHREIDLAMMQLFGGFSPRVFEAYHDLYPLEKGWEKRGNLLQLFYLLVHLNIFGPSYFDAAERIIKRYMG